MSSNGGRHAARARIEPSDPRYLPDDDTIKVVAQTDRRAAADLVIRKYRDPLFHHAAWILKDWQEAIDVTQEVFIKAMREDRSSTRPSR